MALVLLTYLKKTVNYKYLILIFVSLIGLNSHAQCNSSTLALESAQDLFSRRQFLLSVQEFSIAEKFDCQKNVDRALWGRLLAITELGERDEMFHLAYKLYPNRLSANYQARLKVYQYYYFPKEDGSVDSQRVEAFTRWKENLPKQKSPLLAGTMSAVLPGMGQAYTGSWQSGAMAFFLNALFLSTTLEFAENDLHAASLASGVVFSITYLGNILNAAESARIYNQNYNTPQIEDEKAKRFPELNL